MSRQRTPARDPRDLDLEVMLPRLLRAEIITTDMVMDLMKLGYRYWKQGVGVPVPAVEHMVDKIVDEHKLFMFCNQKGTEDS